MTRVWGAVVAGLVGCTGVPAGVDAVQDGAAVADSAPDAEASGSAAAASATDPFADKVVAFEPGPGAGFGQAKLPQVVLGAPAGKGKTAGSLDVVSLGKGGVITLEFTDVLAIDGPGADLVVFENAFTGWVETGHVSASADGVTWHEWPCAAADPGRAGCAGVGPVLSAPDNGIDPTDPAVAGGDAFDLAVLGIGKARFVRIRDSGLNPNDAPTAGFDLDAVAVVHGAPPLPRPGP